MTFAVANFVAMAVWPGWETIPFHFVWISLTLLYGFRVWRPAATYFTLLAVIAVTGGLILSDAFSGDQLWGELFEVPLMSAMSSVRQRNAPRCCNGRNAFSTTRRTSSAHR